MTMGNGGHSSGKEYNILFVVAVQKPSVDLLRVLRIIPLAEIFEQSMPPGTDITNIIF